MEQNYYNPKNIGHPLSESLQEDVDNGYLAEGKDFFLSETEERVHIGQPYEKDFARVLECKYCKGKLFNVAQGSYITVVRCIQCEYEVTVHDG